MSPTRLAGLPWTTIATCLGALLLAALPGAAPALSLSSEAVVAGRIDTLVASQLIHWDWSHTVACLAAFAPLAFACERRYRRAVGLLLASAALAVGLAVLSTLGPDQTYRGISGITHALLTAALAGEVLDPTGDRSRRRLAGLALAVVAAKVGYESIAGTILFPGRFEGFMPWPAAHLSGAAAGVVFALATALWTARGPGRGPAAARPRSTAPAAGASRVA